MLDHASYPPSDTQLGGFNEILGLVIEERSSDVVRAHLVVHKKLLQPYGIVHGGVYATIAETTASLGAALWHLDRTPGGRVVGVNNATSFCGRLGKVRGCTSSRRRCTAAALSSSGRSPSRTKATGLSRTAKFGWRTSRRIGPFSRRRV